MEVVFYGMVNGCGSNDGVVLYLGGDSNSEKPTEWYGAKLGIGSLFLELDTNTFFYFDGTNWAEVGA